jgi:hypothetical protein
MQENPNVISRREQYVPTRWTKFLWWLSTAEPEILKDCMIDRNRYAIVGMTVLATWSFATLAWTYFFSTVVDHFVIAIFLGIFMGGIILTIDRALIKGISKQNKRRWIPLAFRGILACVIGIFMAQPALLYLFNKEIHVQISIDNEQKKKDKRQKQDSSWYAQKAPLVQKRKEMQQQLDSRYAEVATSRDGFIKETDGTGGSKKIGLKDIAQAKQREYLKLEADYQQLRTLILPQLHQTDSLITVVDAAIQKEQVNFEALLNDGFITRIEALNHLVENNNAVAFRYYLLVMILLLIELMPVISKSMLPEGTYDEKVMLREKIEKELTQKNHERELALQELYNQTAFEQDADFIKDFLKESSEKKKNRMKERVSDWGKENGEFDGLWNEMKEDYLSKQEN